MRRNLKRISILLAIFSTFTILLSSSFGLQINQGAWAGTATSSRLDIYDMNAEDGSDVTNISNNPSSHDQTPNWAPDGTKIAFTSDRDGNNEIYVINADGSEHTRLTNSPGSDEFPDWSPDGTKIAFASLRDGNWEIYVINAEDGSELTRLTNHVRDDVQVDWAPDGTKIAFTSDRDGSQEIYVMNADGSNPTRLTDGPGSNTVADWGTVPTPTFAGENGKIAFTSTRDGSQEIYVMNADGSEQTRLTNVDPDDPLLGNKADPSWSPDAQEIAFVHNNNEIYVMNAEDGSEHRPLSNDLTPKRHPAWSPDGTKIAFDHPTEPPATPSEAIEQLISDIENLEDNVPQGTKTSLAAPLRQASTILTDDNPNNDESVCGNLDAFINQVNAAERRGTLTEQQATDLRTDAEDIRTDLGC